MKSNHSFSSYSWSNCIHQPTLEDGYLWKGRPYIQLQVTGSPTRQVSNVHAGTMARFGFKKIGLPVSALKYFRRSRIIMGQG